MSEMVEKVARAIHAAQGGETDTGAWYMGVDGPSPDLWKFHIPQARAAIDASGADKMKAALLEIRKGTEECECYFWIARAADGALK